MDHSYTISHRRAAKLGLVVRVEYDYDGDMYAIYKDGKRIEAGVISLDKWLDGYAASEGSAY